MNENPKCIVTTYVVINALLITTETLTQILHYSLTQWANIKIKQVGLMFILMRPIFHFIIFLLYIIFHCEPILTYGKKLLTFPLHMISIYIGYTPWVHMSFFSKYYLESESGIVISKIVNGFCFVFVSLPKLLLIPINSNAVGSWKGIDIVSLIMSCFYIIFLIIYYFQCGKYDFEFELELEDMSKIWGISVADNQDNNDELFAITEKPIKVNEVKIEIDPNNKENEKYKLDIDIREIEYQRYVAQEKRKEMEMEMKYKNEKIEIDIAYKNLDQQNKKLDLIKDPLKIENGKIQENDNEPIDTKNIKNSTKYIVIDDNIENKEMNGNDFNPSN